MGLIFVVEGTHENFNTTKISAYTVLMYGHMNTHTSGGMKKEEATVCVRHSLGYIAT